MTMPEIAAKMRAGELSEGALFWCEGWSDWREIEGSPEMAAQGMASLCRGSSRSRCPAVPQERAASGWQLGGLAALVVLAVAIFANQESLTESFSAREQKIQINSDGSVEQVKRYIEREANDPASVAFVEWSPLEKIPTGYRVRVKYRAKNGFGALMLESRDFELSESGDFVAAARSR